MKKQIIAIVAAITIFFCGMPGFAATEYNCGQNIHRYAVTNTMQATETASGWRSYVCELCGYQYQSEIPPTGHDWYEWDVVKEPSCQEEGLQVRVCANFPEHRQEQIMSTTEHLFIATMQTDATCTDTGNLQLTCSVCGAKTQESIMPHGHLWGEWMISKKPTIQSAGKQYRVCAYDSTHIQEEILPALEIKVTAVDIVIGTTSVSLVWLFTALICSDIGVLLWYKRHKKEQLETLEK